MRIFGFRWKRFVEWKSVLDEERKTDSLPKLIACMAWIALRGLPHLKENRRLWRHKMRTCHKCPIHDRGLHRCGPYTGSPLGCKCFTPFLALFKRRCWADEFAPEHHFGWTTLSQNPVALSASPSVPEQGTTELGISK